MTYRYLLSLTYRGIIIKQNKTKICIFNFTADVLFAAKRDVIRNWVRFETGPLTVASLSILLSYERTTKVLIILRGSVGWSALLTFACSYVRFP